MIDYRRKRKTKSDGGIRILRFVSIKRTSFQPTRCHVSRILETSGTSVSSICRTRRLRNNEYARIHWKWRNAANLLAAFPKRSNCNVPSKFSFRSAEGLQYPDFWAVHQSRLRSRVRINTLPIACRDISSRNETRVCEPCTENIETVKNIRRRCILRHSALNISASVIYSTLLILVYLETGSRKSFPRKYRNTRPAVFRQQHTGRDTNTGERVFPIQPTIFPPRGLLGSIRSECSGFDEATSVREGRVAGQGREGRC